MLLAIPLSKPNTLKIENKHNNIKIYKIELIVDIDQNNIYVFTDTQRNLYQVVYAMMYTYFFIFVIK